MIISLTGATGFLGNYLIDELIKKNFFIKALYRDEAKIKAKYHNNPNISWIKGNFESSDIMDKLIKDSDCIIHTAVKRNKAGFQKDVKDLKDYLNTNLFGSINLIDRAYCAGIKKFIFVSSCAVHAKILEDRNLDEMHPLYPDSHYGAYKASIEAFIATYASKGFDILSIRPTGIYGKMQNQSDSKWYDLIKNIKKNQDVQVNTGGKEVHVKDVAKSISLLIQTNNTRGEVFNCYDSYISEYDVAHIAKEICLSKSNIIGTQKKPKHQIDNIKLKKLGFKFGGKRLLREYVEELCLEI